MIDLVKGFRYVQCCHINSCIFLVKIILYFFNNINCMATGEFVFETKLKLRRL